MLDMTYDESGWDDPYDEDWDDEVFEALAEDWDDDEQAEFIGAILPGPLKALDPIGAALGAATGIGKKRPARPPGRRPATAPGRPFYSAPASKNYVTQTQLKSSLAKVTADVRKNAAGIKTVNGKADSNRSRLNQQNAINVRQGRQIGTIRREMEQQAQTQMLMSLLSRTEDVTVVSDSSGELASGTKLRFDREIDPITFLLPALAGGKSSGSGLNNPLLLLALMR
jgi:hypothetical protein